VTDSGDNRSFMFQVSRMSEIKLWNASTFEARAKFGGASNQETEKHYYLHSCLIFQKILIQYPLICDLAIIHNEQLSPNITYNETRTR